MSGTYAYECKFKLDFRIHVHSSAYSSLLIPSHVGRGPQTVEVKLGPQQERETVILNFRTEVTLTSITKKKVDLGTKITAVVRVQ